MRSGLKGKQHLEPTAVHGVDMVMQLLEKRDRKRKRGQDGEGLVRNVLANIRRGGLNANPRKA